MIRGEVGKSLLLGVEVRISTWLEANLQWNLGSDLKKTELKARGEKGRCLMPRTPTRSQKDLG